MRPLLVAAIAALVLGGCVPDQPFMQIVSDRKPVVRGTDPEAFAIPQGAAVAVEPIMIHDDIEGTSNRSVTDARPDDPSIVRVVHATRDFALTNADVSAEKALVLVGLVPGTTTLHLYRDTDEVGAVLLQVVAQDP